MLASAPLLVRSSVRAWLGFFKAEMSAIDLDECCRSMKFYRIRRLNEVTLDCRLFWFKVPKVDLGF